MEITHIKKHSEGARVSKMLKNDSDLCTQACPYRLAGSALPPKTGAADTKGESNQVFI